MPERVFCTRCGTRAPSDSARTAIARKPMDELARAIADARLAHEQATPATKGQLTGGCAGQLMRTASAAYRAGTKQDVTAALLDARDGATGVGRMLLSLAMLRENDGEFHGHGIAGLDIRRIELAGARSIIEDLGLELTATADGGVVARSARPGERILVTVASPQIQLLASNADERKAIEVHDRGYDCSGLSGHTRMLYEFRVVRRLLWGVGQCMLTDQRAAGVIFQRDPPSGGTLTREREAMPHAVVRASEDRTTIGSVLVFSVNRVLFDEAEVIAPLLIGKSMPDVFLMGDVSLAFDARSMVDERDRIVKPPKGRIASAVAKFAPGVRSDLVRS